MPQIVQL